MSNIEKNYRVTRWMKRAGVTRDFYNNPDNQHLHVNGSDFEMMCTLEYIEALEKKLEELESK